MALRPQFNREDNHCFGCGSDNPIGLKLQFKKEGGKVKAEFTPGQYHQGWSDVLHGGLICALLDEVMGYVTFFEGIYALTAKMELRFRQPVRIGQRLLLSGEIKKRRRNLIETQARIEFEDGTLVAEAKAVMFETK